MRFAFINLANILKNRIVAAVSTIPSLKEINYLLGALSVYAFIALLLGFKTKFLEIKITKNLAIVSRVVLTALFTPAIAEEIFFRVLLLPYPTENISSIFRAVSIAISLFLFIIYHPLNGFTLFVAGRETFIDPIFLLLAAGLGICCTVLYLISGSLWTPVVFHWLIVVIWLLCLGGYDKLR